MPRFEVSLSYLVRTYLRKEKRMKEGGGGIREESRGKGKIERERIRKSNHFKNGFRGDALEIASPKSRQNLHH